VLDHCRSRKSHKTRHPVPIGQVGASRERLFSWFVLRWRAHTKRLPYALILINTLGRMSALGQKQTFGSVRLMSALPPKADIRTTCFKVLLSRLLLLAGSINVSMNGTRVPSGRSAIASRPNLQRN